MARRTSAPSWRRSQQPCLIGRAAFSEPYPLCWGPVAVAQIVVLLLFLKTLGQFRASQLQRLLCPSYSVLARDVRSLPLFLVQTSRTDQFSSVIQVCGCLPSAVAGGGVVGERQLQQERLPFLLGLPQVLVDGGLDDLISPFHGVALRSVWRGPSVFNLVFF